MEFGYLAALVAGMLGWIAFMIERDELNLDAADSEGFRTNPLAPKSNCSPVSTPRSKTLAALFNRRPTNTWTRGRSRWAAEPFPRIRAAS